MTPFHHHFPECAATERLALHVQQPGLPLPPGEYVFVELYCEDPACDCRRVLLQAVSPQRPGGILATINYGWESEAYYTRWMHGDAEAGREITSACLDPLNPQSELACALLDAFRDYVRSDPACPRQLARHYAMFKSTQHPPPPPPMTPDEILRQLQQVPRKGGFAPFEAALLAAPLHREALVPRLIDAIDRVTADPAHYLGCHDDCLHEFAFHLLAQFRETRALDAFLRFLSLPGDDAIDLTGDMITQYGAAVLASVCGGDPAPLLRLAKDESVNQYVRSQAIEGLLVQCGWGERPRDAVIAGLRGLFDTLPRPGNDHVWASLVCALCDFEARELLPEARRAFAEGLVDESIVGPNALDELESPGSGRFPLPPGASHFDLLMERNAPIDAVAECSTWLCFSDDDLMDDDWDDPDFDDDEAGADEPPFAQSSWSPPEPFIAPPKVGRNDPCPCGSGRKYKKCCGRNQ